MRYSRYQQPVWQSAMNRPGTERAAADGELVRLAQAGDAAAVAEIYRTYVQAIYRYALARVGESETAEDLTSDVFLRAIEALGRYRHRGAPLGAWLFRIARDRVSDHHRRRARRPTRQLDDELVDEHAGPEAEALRRRDLAQLRSELDRLTLDQQDVIYLRFTQGFTLVETSIVMRRTTGAVKALQFRAVQALARHMK